MKRYYLSRIFQDDGTYNSIPGVWMHKLQTYPNVEYADSGEIATDPTTGVPTQLALLVLVAAKDHAKFVADPDMVEMPLVPADVRVNAISAAARSKAQNGAAAIGWTLQQASAVWNAADDFRDVVNHYGRLNNPAFNADKFDVNEN